MELRSCYFCGVAGRTVERTAVDGATVALCPACEGKLARLDRAADAAGDVGPVTFGGTDGAGETVHDAAPVATDDPAETGEQGEQGGGATETGETVDDPPQETTEAEDGATDSPSEGTTEAGDEPTDDPADPDADGADPPTGLHGLGAGERGGGSPYRKALRLLGNREFPLERAAAVDLLSGAYDLDPAECERLVDLTVERGLLVEEDGELRRAP
jgi:hypothetical protein